jgi:hypothetical protein
VLTFYPTLPWAVRRGREVCTFGIKVELVDFIFKRSIANIQGDE